MTAPAPDTRPERTVHVGPERLARWFAGFAERHGAFTATETETAVRLDAADGATADCAVPFPPLPDGSGSLTDRLVAHAMRERVLGLVLVRRGGFAAGVFEGNVAAATRAGSRHVQGRTAAGGWSQQRFARRRDGQTRRAVEAAADTVAAVLLPAAGRLDAVVAGGDRLLVDELFSDPRLSRLRSLLTGTLLDVADPSRRVLLDAWERTRAVRIRVVDPPA